MKKTIYILPGSSDILRLHLKLVRFLMREGYQNIHIAPEGWGWRPIQEIAKDIRKDIIKKKLNNLTVISASLGSVLTKYLMVNYPEIEKRIQKVIAICSPFQGTWLAVPFAFIPSYKQLIPGNKLLKKLHEQKKVNKKFVSLRPWFDTEVMPLRSEVLPGAKNRMVPVIGHILAPYRTPMLNAVKNELS